METALHNLTRTIEYSFHHKDILEGSFNNVDASAIASALTSLKVDGSLGELIYQMLTSRVINSKLGCFSARRFVSRGTPAQELLTCLETGVIE